MLQRQREQPVDANVAEQEWAALIIYLPFLRVPLGTLQSATHGLNDYLGPRLAGLTGAGARQVDGDFLNAS